MLPGQTEILYHREVREEMVREFSQEQAYHTKQNGNGLNLINRVRSLFTSEEKEKTAVSEGTTEQPCCKRVAQPYPQIAV